MDYPLWGNNRITSWLEEQGQQEILQGINMNTPFINELQHEQYTRSRPLFRLFNNKWNQRLSILCRKMLVLCGYRKRLSFTVDGRKWDLYKGSAWWCISEELASFVLQSYLEKPEIKEYFTDSFGQAETIVQTIAFNSPLWASKCLLTEGKYPGLNALTPLHYIDYNPVVKVLTEEDFPALVRSKKMFARKFRTGVSEGLMEQIDNNLRVD